MSEVTNAMARVGEAEAVFGSAVFDYVHRAKDAVHDLWFEAIRAGMSDAVIARRRAALYRAEANCKEYGRLMLNRLSA